MFKFIENEDFDNHRIVSFICDESVGLRGYVAIHRNSKKTPAFGATRLWNYSSDSTAITDVLKLSKLMTYKSLLAGYHYGGSKVAIITDKSKPINKTNLLRAYAHIVSCFRGAFITGADVGMDNEDLQLLASESPYVMGVNSDPVRYTIEGIYSCIPTCVGEVYGSTTLNGRSIAIQGLGKIGYGLLQKLYGTGIKIYASDINVHILSQITERYPEVILVEPNLITETGADIFSPCALSGAINATNIHTLQCKIVIGSANCQLESDSLGEQLHRRNILYAPDYIVNAGGLMGVVEEYEQGRCEQDRIAKKIAEIPNTLQLVLKKSKEADRSTIAVANSIALERMNEI